MTQDRCTDTMFCFIVYTDVGPTVWEIWSAFLVKKILASKFKGNLGDHVNCCYFLKGWYGRWDIGVSEMISQCMLWVANLVMLLGCAILLISAFMINNCFPKRWCYFSIFSPPTPFWLHFWHFFFIVPNKIFSLGEWLLSRSPHRTVGESVVLNLLRGTMENMSRPVKSSMKLGTVTAVGSYY